MNKIASKADLKKIDKNYTQKLHFKKRFKQRLGEDCSRTTYLNVLKQVESPTNRILILKQSNRVRWYGVSVLDKRCIVVFDSIRRVLVTIFVEESFNTLQEEAINSMSLKSKKKWDKLLKYRSF